MSRFRLLAAPLGLAALGVGGAVANAQIVAPPPPARVIIVGNPQQLNSQANTGSQNAIQQSGGGVDVGATIQGGTNSVANGQGQAQTIGNGAAGSTHVGTSNQQNTQGVVEQQSQVQLAGSNSGTVVGSETQVAANSASTGQSGGQAEAFVTIVGSPIQGNVQYQGASQGVQQTDPGVIVGALVQAAGNGVGAAQANAQAVGSTAAAVVVGSPLQANSQNMVEPQFIGQLGATGTIVGNTTQTQANAAANTTTSAAIIL
jgi:hypothetical protein